MDHSPVDCRFSDLNRSSSELKTAASKKIIHLQSLAVESFDGIVVINYQSALNLSNKRSVLERDEILLYFQSEKSFVKDVQQDAATTTSENYFDKQLQTNAKWYRSYNRKQEELNELKSPENVEEEKQLKKKCSFPRRKKISEMTPEQRHVKREYNIKMAGKSSKF